jgi:small subunit ribosomal protein S2
VRGARTPTDASLSTLMASGAALGHAKELLNPAYTPYVYGNRSGLSIIDLEQTLPMLRRAAAVVRDVVKEDGTVLFLGSRAGHKKALAAAKERLGDNGYVSGDWLPGTITNAESV